MTAADRRTTTSQTLRHALALLERDGWCKVLARDAEGRRCTLGAINAALGRDEGADVTDGVRAAVRALRVCGEGTPHRRLLVDWNDAEDRTEDEVLEAFRAAIAREEGRS